MTRIDGRNPMGNYDAHRMVHHGPWNGLGWPLFPFQFDTRVLQLASIGADCIHLHPCPSPHLLCPHPPKKSYRHWHLTSLPRPLPLLATVQFSKRRVRVLTVKVTGTSTPSRALPMSLPRTTTTILHHLFIRAHDAIFPSLVMVTSGSAAVEALVHGGVTDSCGVVLETLGRSQIVPTGTKRYQFYTCRTREKAFPPLARL